MTHEDLKGKSYKEMEVALEGELLMFTEEISTIEDENVLKEKEQAIINELEEYDKYLDTVAYELPDGCEYDGQTFKKGDIAKAIIYNLNKMEVEFQYTLGMYQLVRLWKDKDLKEISYKAYDSTLRCLNGVKFKGYQDWQDILAINEFMSQCHDRYKSDLAWYIFLSTKHNTIMDRMKMLVPVEELGDVNTEVPTC